MEPKDWIKLEKNIKKISLNLLFVPYNTETLSLAYRSEYSNKRKKQVSLLGLLMAINGIILL